MEYGGAAKVEEENRHDPKESEGEGQFFLSCSKELVEADTDHK